VLRVVVHRQHHDAGVGSLATDLAQGPEPVSIRHAQIEEADVRLPRHDRLDCGTPRRRLTHDLDALGVGQCGAQATQDEAMVVGDHDPYTRTPFLYAGFARHGQPPPRVQRAYVSPRFPVRQISRPHPSTADARYLSTL